ncbi:MAG TPA: hypothetical protein VE968_02235 [Sphingomicrobium sp.]|nr:hypothetical protein [Sphingomicrobium sp.]
MKNVALLCGAAALALGASLSAKPGNGNGHGQGHSNVHEASRGSQGFGAGGCPPGLRKKGCMPPGQAKKLARGERYESGYGAPYSYGRIPAELRRRYRLSSRYRYYYDNGTIYAVDPRTLVIAQVISALAR